jgi:hypothetical protein
MEFIPAFQCQPMSEGDIVDFKAPTTRHQTSFENTMIINIHSQRKANVLDFVCKILRSFMHVHVPYKELYLSSHSIGKNYDIFLTCIWNDHIYIQAYVLRITESFHLIENCISKAVS